MNIYEMRKQIQLVRDLAGNLSGSQAEMFRQLADASELLLEGRIHMPMPRQPHLTITLEQAIEYETLASGGWWGRWRRRVGLWRAKRKHDRYVRIRRLGRMVRPA